MLKEETVKKRLSRARKAVASQSILFEIPDAKDLPNRLDRVLEVIYLTFNEGFYSNNKEILIRQELCGEAIRLCQLLLQEALLRNGKVYALFALMCFHTARLESRVDDAGETIDLKNQDRSKWYFSLMELGNNAMIRATEQDEFSAYHFEAAIAAEHLKAKSFSETDWSQILHWYDQLLVLQVSAFTLLNKSIVLIQMERFAEAKKILNEIDLAQLEQRKYLYFSAFAEYYHQIEENDKAIQAISKAIKLVNSEPEKRYLHRKLELYSID